MPLDPPAFASTRLPPIETFRLNVGDLAASKFGFLHSGPLGLFINSWRVESSIDTISVSFRYESIAAIIGTVEEVQTATERRPERTMESSSLMVRRDEVVEGLLA